MKKKLLSLKEIHKYLIDKQSSILMQVHDEIICEIHDSEIDTIPWKLKELLEENSLNIPLVVDMEVCEPSWATKRGYGEEPEVVEDIIEDYIDWS